MLGDDIAQALPYLRAQAESLMIDTCIITRPGAGKGEFNEATGKYDAPARVTIYGPGIEPHHGKCQLVVQSATNSASPSNSGDRTAIVQGDVLKLPVIGTGDVSNGDVAKMVTSPTDPSLVDREFTVTGRHAMTNATARRLPVKEVAG